MIAHLYLIIFLAIDLSDSSSIRSRNPKNELVTIANSKSDLSPRKDSNAMKIISSEPFIIQLAMPNDFPERGKKEEGKSKKEKKRKRPAKNRLAKLKALRKRYRIRRDVNSSGAKPTLSFLGSDEEESDTGKESVSGELLPQHENVEHEARKKRSQESVSFLEALDEALSTKNGIGRGESDSSLEENFSEEYEDEEDGGWMDWTKNQESVQKRIHPRFQQLISDGSTMEKTSPEIPKGDKKDFSDDLERMDQKINYVKKLLGFNESDIYDEGIRVRRKTEADRTANKIAKMFLTLSAMNEFHGKTLRKPKLRDEEEDSEEEEEEGGEGKDKVGFPAKKNQSSNEERYKVKKWIEQLKSKRSNRFCPCQQQGQKHNSEEESFPFDKKLQRGYWTHDPERSSEEIIEETHDRGRNYFPRYGGYYPRLRSGRDYYGRCRYPRIGGGNLEETLKALRSRGRRKLEFPLEDLEVYRSRAKKILQNAEDILDKIKEEEEKRHPKQEYLTSYLKELKSRAQTDPINSDFIQLLQKALGWHPPQKEDAEKDEEENGNTYVDKIMAYFTDPYEKARELTEESARQLTTYILKNFSNSRRENNDRELKIKPEAENQGGSMQTWQNKAFESGESELFGNSKKETEAEEKKPTETSPVLKILNGYKTPKNEDAEDASDKSKEKSTGPLKKIMIDLMRAEKGEGEEEEENRPAVIREKQEKNEEISILSTRVQKKSKNKSVKEKIQRGKKVKIDLENHKSPDEEVIENDSDEAGESDPERQTEETFQPEIQENDSDDKDVDDGFSPKSAQAYDETEEKDQKNVKASVEDNGDYPEGSEKKGKDDGEAGETLQSTSVPDSYKEIESQVKEDASSEKEKGEENVQSVMEEEAEKTDEKTDTQRKGNSASEKGKQILKVMDQGDFDEKQTHNQDEKDEENLQQAMKEEKPEDAEKKEQEPETVQKMKDEEKESFDEGEKDFDGGEDENVEQTMKGSNGADIETNEPDGDLVEPEENETVRGKTNEEKEGADAGKKQSFDEDENVEEMMNGRKPADVENKEEDEEKEPETVEKTMDEEKENVDVKERESLNEYEKDRNRGEEEEENVQEAAKKQKTSDVEANEKEPETVQNVMDEEKGSVDAEEEEEESFNKDENVEQMAKEPKTANVDVGEKDDEKEPENVQRMKGEEKESFDGDEKDTNGGEYENVEQPMKNQKSGDVDANEKELETVRENVDEEKASEDSEEKKMNRGEDDENVQQTMKEDKAEDVDDEKELETVGEKKDEEKESVDVKENGEESVQQAMEEQKGADLDAIEEDEDNAEPEESETVQKIMGDEKDAETNDQGKKDLDPEEDRKPLQIMSKERKKDESKENETNYQGKKDGDLEIQNLKLENDKQSMPNVKTMKNKGLEGESAQDDSSGEAEENVGMTENQINEPDEASANSGEDESGEVIAKSNEGEKGQKIEDGEKEKEAYDPDEKMVKSQYEGKEPIENETDANDDDDDDDDDDEENVEMKNKDKAESKTARTGEEYASSEGDEEVQKTASESSENEKEQDSVTGKARIHQEDDERTNFIDETEGKSDFPVGEIRKSEQDEDTPKLGQKGEERTIDGREDKSISKESKEEDQVESDENSGGEKVQLKQDKKQMESELTDDQSEKKADSSTDDEEGEGKKESSEEKIDDSENDVLASKHLTVKDKKTDPASAETKDESAVLGKESTDSVTSTEDDSKSAETKGERVELEKDSTDSLTSTEDDPKTAETKDERVGLDKDSTDSLTSTEDDSKSVETKGERVELEKETPKGESAELEKESIDSVTSTADDPKSAETKDERVELEKETPKGESAELEKESIDSVTSTEDDPKSAETKDERVKLEKDSTDSLTSTEDDSKSAETKDEGVGLKKDSTDSLTSTEDNFKSAETKDERVGLEKDTAKGESAELEKESTDSVSSTEDDSKSPETKDERVGLEKDSRKGENAELEKEDSLTSTENDSKSAEIKGERVGLEIDSRKGESAESVEESTNSPTSTEDDPTSGETKGERVGLEKDSTKSESAESEKESADSKYDPNSGETRGETGGLGKGPTNPMTVTHNSNEDSSEKGESRPKENLESIHKDNKETGENDEDVPGTETGSKEKKFSPETGSNEETRKFQPETLEYVVYLDDENHSREPEGRIDENDWREDQEFPKSDYSKDWLSVNSPDEKPSSGLVEALNRGTTGKFLNGEPEDAKSAEESMVKNGGSEISIPEVKERPLRLELADDEPTQSIRNRESEEVQGKSANPIADSDNRMWKEGSERFEEASSDRGAETGSRREGQDQLRARHPFEDDTMRYYDDPALVGNVPGDYESLETSQEIYPPLREMTSESVRGGKGNGKMIELKVPAEIEKLIKDLNDGKEKEEIDSIQSLDPTKIDRYIGQIDQAESENQRHEADCRKECACAENIDSLSRKSGRYEIVKDFLHWVKDLRMNRVLSDD